MGLGIVFCMTEVRLLSDVSAVLEQGFAPDPKLAQMTELFPATWCTFELIQMLRILYFFAFECICAFSIIFVPDELKVKVEKSLEVVNNMNWIKRKTFKIYEKTVRWADITDAERVKMAERREKHPDLPESELKCPQRFMLDLNKELLQPRYRQ